MMQLFYHELAEQVPRLMDQIRLTLGHVKTTTSERCIGVKLDLVGAPCDRLGLSASGGPAVAAEAGR
jgi:hypothetical protein